MISPKLLSWINEPKINQILISFSTPQTPTQITEKLGIKRPKMKSFLEKNLIEALNPEAKKGRLYTLTEKARGLLNLSTLRDRTIEDWKLMGEIAVSPKQKKVVLKVMDNAKRTSKKIRERALNFNPKLSQSDVAEILKDLIDSGLAEGEKVKNRKYYWITNKGKEISNALTDISN